MDVGTIVDVHSVELLTGALGLIFTILYSFVKPSDWSPNLKRNVAIVVSGALGVYIAYTNGKTNPTDFIGYAGLAVGVSQLVYKQVLARFGVEDKIVSIREATIDLGAHPRTILKPLTSDPWMNGIDAVLNAVELGELTKEQGQQAIDALNHAKEQAPGVQPPV